MQTSSFSEFLKAAGKARTLEADHADDPVIVAAVMRSVLDDTAAGMQPDAKVEVVSVTLDALGQGDVNQAIVFETRLDRQTRTLIFMSGLAQQGETAVLKATAIYRIS